MLKTMLRAAAVAALVCVMPIATAQTTYSVFIDTDGSATSGCDVTYPGGVVRGAEVRFDIPVTLGASPQVGQFRQSTCGGGSFVPGPLLGTPYVAGTNNGLFGSDVIELQVVQTTLPGLSAPALRFAVAAEGGGASDVLLTRTGANDGGPVVLGIPTLPIPTMGALGLVLLGVLVLVVGARKARSRLRVMLAGGLLLVSGVVLATSFIADGQVNDWAGATPLATDPAGDPTNGSVALDLRALFGAIDGGMLTVRVDVADLQNRPPVANAQAVTLLEDAAATTITLTGTDPEAAPLTFSLGTAPTRGTLGPLTPTGPTSATVTYTPNANANGADSFSFRVNDGVLTSPDATVAITITPVNDAPAFTASTPPTILEDAGTQTIANWAGFNPGPPDESTQTATYTVSAISNAALFSTAPAVAPNGTLSYTPAANANGTSTFTVTVRDSGGTANGGVDTSPPQTFTINVTAVNDAPVFTAGPNQTIDEDAGAQTVNPWATAISAGPPDEAAQTLTFNVTGNTNAALFSAAPAVSPTGVLTYTPAANANGSATITLSLSDSGSNTPPNQNTSAPQTFTVTVNAVNDAPVNTVPGAQTTGDAIPLVFSTANANAISVADADAGTGLVQMTFATGAAANGTLSLANPGGGLATLTGNGTATVVATGTITALNTALNGPAGGLTYTPVAGTAAARTITVTTNDQGNTGSGGPQVDTDTITVNVDAPPVVSSVPANGAVIAENAAITVNFSEPVNVAAGVTFTCTAGTVSGLGGTTGSNVSALNLTYAGVLGGTCTLTVPSASVSDVDTIDPPNNPVTDYVATFTVDAAPTVTATTPTTGSTTANNVALQISFSEPVNATNAVTLTCGGPNLITGGASGSNVTALAPTYAAPLPAGSCTLTVLAASVIDSDAIDPPNNLPANVVVNFTVDAAPAFVSSVPATDGAVVGTGQAVSFTFDEPVANLGGAITLDCGGNVAGTISGGGTPTLSFTPTNPLTAGASCTATAVAAQIGDSDAFDPPQNPVANVVRTFTVDAAPTLTSVTPANGATNVGLASNITVTFSEPVDFAAGAFTLACPNGSPVAFTVSGTGTATATIDPTPVTLPINTLCRFTVDMAQVTDVDTADPPNAGTGITTVNFTTVNDSAPSVTSAEVEIGNVFTALPLGTGLGSDANTNIRLIFSEPVNPTGAWATLACSVSGTRGVGTGLAVTEADPVFTLNPATDLAPGETCTLTVFAAQVTDDDAIDPPNNMATDFVATFSVDAAPSVATVTPANGATAVALSSTVSVSFSEPVTIGSAAAFSIQCPSGTLIGYTVTTPATLPATATTFVLTPTVPLAGSTTCEFRVFASQVSDGDNADPPDTMAADFTSSFTTVDTPPAVTGTTPANGATNVNPTSAITINFSEPVNFSTVANAANTSFDLECPTGTPADFAVVTASPASSVVLNPLDSAIAARTCTLTVRAAGITDVDAVDPPDNMAADFSASFGFGGIATNDSYQVTPHLTLAIPTTGIQNGGVLANDLVGSGAVTGFGFAPNCTGTSPGSQLDAGSPNGRLTLNADGSFSYQPPAGIANTTRTFCYTVTGGLTANIAFNLENTELVWFVDAAAAASGTGTQARPFQTLIAASGVDTPSDAIFIESGSYTCGIALEAGTRLVGKGATEALDTMLGIVPVAGSAFPATSGTRPTLGVGSGTCVGLATNNRLRGFDIGNSGTDVLGVGFVTLGMSEMALGGSGQALDLENGNVIAATIDSIESTSGATRNVRLRQVAGALTVSGATTLSGATGTALEIDGGSATVTFTGPTTVTKTTSGAGVLLNAHSGLVSFSQLNVTTAIGAALSADNANVDINAGTLSATGGPGVTANSTNWNTTTLTSVSSSGSSTQGINLNAISGTLTMNGGSLATSTGTAFAGQGTLGTTSYAGSISKATAGKLVTIIGAATGSVTLGGALSCTSACTGIDVLNRGAGTIAFTGSSKVLNTGANPAVTLTTNSGATVNFTGGGLAISTTSGTGFNATGGGTVTVQGSGNTLTSTTGTAVNVNATTIGAAGMSFQSINSTTASANTAIVLTNTGAGAFSVTGTGAAGTGGTLSNKTVDAVQLNTTGGLVSLDRMIIEDIGTMTGAIDTRSGHDAIEGLNVNGGLSLTGTTIRRISDQAIHGGVQGSPDTATVWNGLTLAGVTIENTNRYHVANSGDANNEGTVRILGIRGTVSLTNSTLSLGAQPLDLEVTGGTLNLTATGNTFDRSYKEFTSGTRASIGNHCIDVRVLAGATANVVVGDRVNAALANNFLNCRLGSIRIVNQPGAGANTDAIIARNNFRVNDHSSGIGGDFDFPMGGTLVWNLGSGSVDTIVENNLFELVTNASGGVGQLSLIAEGGPVQALVQNNTFDRPGNAPWWVQSRGSAASVMTARFVGNTVIRGQFPCVTDPACGPPAGYFAPGLRALADAQAGATLNFTMENNVMARHDTGSDPGQTVEVRALNTGAGPTVCGRFLNNRSPDGYSLEQLAGTVRTVAAAGSCAAGNPSATCQTVFQGNGNLGGAGVDTTNPPFVNVFGAVTVNNTACPIPTGGPF